MKKYPITEEQREKTHRGVFKRIIKKRHPELIEDWRELFAEYYIDYQNDKVRSINEFLYIDRLRLDRGLKPKFKK